MLELHRPRELWLVINRTLVASGALLIGLGGAPVFAQSSQTTEVGGLEEIIVTAQRREESLQSAAIAISAVSSDQLVNAGVSNAVELTKLVPAVQISPTGGVNPTFFVRGIGNFAANPYSDAAVTFNYDGVPIGRPSSTGGTFYDLARVEVLKGPQGTLYGRNATGGAINVLPAHPELGEFGGRVNVEGGNYNLLHVDGALNVPVGDTVAVRGAFNILNRDGYSSTGTNDDEGKAGRLQVLVEPSDDFSLVIGGDYYRQTGRGAGAALLNRTTGEAVDDFWTDLNDPRVCAEFSSYYNVTNAITGNNPCQPNDSSIHNTNWGLNATANWNTALGTLTVVPAHRTSKLDSLTRNNPNLDEVATNDQDSLEIRFASDDEQAFTWIVGAFYMNETTESDFGVALVPGADSVPPSGNSMLHQLLDLETSSWAGFATARYAITDTFRVSAGARYTHDVKDYDNTSVFPPGFPPAASNRLQASQSWDATTGRIGAEFDVAPDSLLYVNVERGYKAGGYFAGTTLDNTSYDPEYVLAYTLGSKNSFLDRRLQLNLEAYFYDYTDQQVSHFAQNGPLPAFITENVGKATIYGAEIDAKYLLLENTLLGVDVQYNHAEYDEFVYSSGTAPVLTGCQPVSAVPPFQYDCSGQEMVQAPSWRGTVAVQQTFPLANGASLIANVSAYYQSALWANAFDYLPFDRVDSSWAGDVSFGFHAADERWSVVAFANNVTDEEIPTLVFGTGLSEDMTHAPFSGSVPTVFYRPPRTYGGRISFKF